MRTMTSVSRGFTLTAFGFNLHSQKTKGVLLERQPQGPGAISKYLFQTKFEGEKIAQMRRLTCYLILLRYSDRDEI